MKMVKLLALAMLGCLLLAGCSDERTKLPAYSFGGQNQGPAFTSSSSRDHVTVLTQVFVTVFDDTAFLAQTPVLEYGEAEMIGVPRDISQGGRIGCKDEEGNPVLITKVVVAGSLTPCSMKDWFRDLPELVAIEGLDLICTDYVTDMSHTFSGCGKLSYINADGWNTQKVTNMTGIFDGCGSLSQKPQWYE